MTETSGDVLFGWTMSSSRHLTRSVAVSGDGTMENKMTGHRSNAVATDHRSRERRSCQEQQQLSHAIPPPTPSLRTQPDLKRDSGIAASFTTSNTRPPIHTGDSYPTATTDHEVIDPAINVQNVQTDAGNSGAPAHEEHQAKGQSRIRSLNGDQAKHTLVELSLSDLASDRVAFSKRGSLLYAGKRMNKAASPSMEDPAAPPPSRMDGMADIPETVDGTVEYREVSTGIEKPTQNGSLVQSHEIISQAERPTPSSSTLHLPSSSTRVLSMEEMTFSSRVRSMYEHGSERAASWTAPSLNGIHEDGAAENGGRDAASPEPTSNGLVVEKTRPHTSDGHSTVRSTSSKTRSSFTKDTRETAGGIEDWDDVNAEDVDRYGFIKTDKRISSVNSNIDRGSNDERYRTAARSKVAGISNGRSSQSLPPGRGSPSIRSTRAQRAGLNSPTQMFRSKDRRAVSHASDMLDLPPGLADVAQRTHGVRTPSTQKRKELAREEKWERMARVNPQRRPSVGKGGGMRFEFNTSDPKLISRTWKGIPDRWRATAWQSFLSSSARKRNIGASDDELMQHYHKLQEEGSADDVQIDMDVPRTINLHVMFRHRYRGGQRLLFRVLHAISLYFPDTGYVQGMASLAATLLCYFDEETAFVMMVRLWQLRGLEQLFAPGFSGLMTALSDFEKDWLSHGDIARKLEELGVSSTAYGTRWYLTLFNMSLPFAAQLRVWDVFMLLGDAAGPRARENGFGGADLDVLHATSAALLDAMREIVLYGDFENVMKTLTSNVRIQDEDMLMQVAKAEWKERKKRG